MPLQLWLPVDLRVRLPPAAEATPNGSAGEAYRYGRLKTRQSPLAGVGIRRMSTRRLLGKSRHGPTMAGGGHRLPDMLGNYEDVRAALLEQLPPAPDQHGAGVSFPPINPTAATDLQAVQPLLAYLGDRPGPVDGRPGSRTRAVTTDFQRSQDSATTGEADAALLTALEAETRRRFGRDRAADIRLVQQLLVVRGFDTGGINGIVGPKTRAALAAFNRSRRDMAADAADARVLDALLARD
jgi:Putative peptidoglycan binding domain